MNDTTYAPRPPRSNWARVIYNILHDNGNRALSKESIWALVPSTMHVPHAYTKFTAALQSMLNHHFLEGRGVRGNRLFRIATAEAHAARKAVMDGYRRNALVKKKAKKRAKKKSKSKPKPTGRWSKSTDRPKPNGLLANIDFELDQTDREIARLGDRKASLRRMRQEAAKL